MVVQEEVALVTLAVVAVQEDSELLNVILQDKL